MKSLISYVKGAAHRFDTWFSSVYVVYLVISWRCIKCWVYVVCNAMLQNDSVKNSGIFKVLSDHVSERTEENHHRTENNESPTHAIKQTALLK
jgi:hypothetical protein